MNKKMVLGLLMLSLVSLVSARIGDSNDYSWMGNMMGGNYGYYGMGFGWIIMLLVLVVLVLLIVWLSKQIWNSDGKRKR